MTHPVYTSPDIRKDCERSALLLAKLSKEYAILAKRLDVLIKKRRDAYRLGAGRRPSKKTQAKYEALRTAAWDKCFAAEKRMSELDHALNAASSAHLQAWKILARYG